MPTGFDLLQKCLSNHEDLNLHYLFRDQLRILVYLTELEKVGFSISGAKLQSEDKAEVAKSILTSPDLRQRPGAVRVAAELCREYGIWCPNIWQLILQQMVTLRQV